MSLSIPEIGSNSFTFAADSAYQTLKSKREELEALRRQLEEAEKSVEEAAYILEEDLVKDFGPYFVSQVGRDVIASLPTVLPPSFKAGDHVLESTFKKEEMQGHAAIKGILNAHKLPPSESTRSFIAVRVELLDEWKRKIAETVIIVYRRYSTSGEMEDTRENKRYDTRATAYKIIYGRTDLTCTAPIFPDCRLREEHLKDLGKLLKGEVIEPSSDATMFPTVVKFARMHKA